jgi:hypothetical protein
VEEGDGKRGGGEEREGGRMEMYLRILRFCLIAPIGHFENAWLEKTI